MIEDEINPSQKRKMGLVSHIYIHCMFSHFVNTQTDTQTHTLTHTPWFVGCECRHDVPGCSTTSSFFSCLFQRPQARGATGSTQAAPRVLGWTTSRWTGWSGYVLGKLLLSQTGYLTGQRPWRTSSTVCSPEDDLAIKRSRVKYCVSNIGTVEGRDMSEDKLLTVT